MCPYAIEGFCLDPQLGAELEPCSQGVTCLPWVSQCPVAQWEILGGVSWQEYFGQIQVLLETFLGSKVLLWTQEVFSLECLTPEKISRV